MAYVYISEGSEASADIEDNYFHFNEWNIDVYNAIGELLSSGMKRDRTFRGKLRSLCSASFRD